MWLIMIAMENTKVEKDISLAHGPLAKYFKLGLLL